MNRCPITYNECGNNLYSEKGLKYISRALTNLKLFPYSAEEQREEALKRAVKMSIQGVQPKISAVISPAESNFKIVDINGTFIIKPQNLLYPYLPENEDLTMRLASEIDMDIPLHGLIYSKDNSMSYFIKRFDRTGRTGKVPVEDFAQLSGKNRETKYNSSMEKVAEIIDEYCTFPLIEKQKLFKVVIFNYLTGNEDHHLKNFSLIRQDKIVQLTPFYDLVNTTIALKNPSEEIALPVGGKRKNLTIKILVDYYAEERLGLNKKTINNVLESIFNALKNMELLIGISFLPEELKQKYTDLLNNRKKNIF